MTIMHMILWLGALGALILSIGIARGSRQTAHGALTDCDLGPGDIDAGHYLASGRITWTAERAGSHRRARQRPTGKVAYRSAMR